MNSSQTNPKADLNSRVAALEAALRMQKRIAVGAVLALCMVCTLGADGGVSDEVAAKNLRVIDTSGNTILLVGTDAGGQPGIWFGKGGQYRNVLYRDANGKILSYADNFYAQEDKALDWRAAFGLGTDGTPGLWLQPRNVAAFQVAGVNMTNDTAFARGGRLQRSQGFEPDPSR